MIEFEVLLSTDVEILGTHTLLKKSLYFGRNKGDVLIADAEIMDNHLLLELTPEGLIATPHKKLTHFLVNGKRTTGKKSLQLQDTLTIGTTTLQIKKFLYTQFAKKQDTLNKNLDVILSDPSMEKTRDILAILEGDLTRIS